MSARTRFWLVGLGYLLATVALTAPFSFHLASRMLSLDSDATLVQWIVSWDIYAFTHQPLHIFDANTFAPLANTLAFAENLIGGALFLWSWSPEWLPPSTLIGPCLPARPCWFSRRRPRSRAACMGACCAIAFRWSMKSPARFSFP